MMLAITHLFFAWIAVAVALVAISKLNGRNAGRVASQAVAPTNTSAVCWPRRSGAHWRP